MWKGPLLSLSLPVSPADALNWFNHWSHWGADEVAFCVFLQQDYNSDFRNPVSGFSSAPEPHQPNNRPLL